MKRIQKIAFLLPLMAILSTLAFAAERGSRYSDIIKVLWSDPYTELPRHAVNQAAFGPQGESPDNRLRLAAIRTLSIDDDLLNFPGHRKLIQPNGICFRGKFQVNRDSPYTGLLAPGSTSLVIARASVALSGTQRGEWRAFGMAIKIFPTLNFDQLVATQNFFVMETLTGSTDGYYLDAVMDNNPDIGSLFGALEHLGLALRLREDLNAADTAVGSDHNDYAYRPVLHLAEYGIQSGSVRAPKWIRLRIAKNTARVEHNDFRDELRVQNFLDQQLVWAMEAAKDASGGKSNANWISLGKLIFTDSITSKSCDGRLHFAHPKLP